MFPPPPAVGPSLGSSGGLPACPSQGSGLTDRVTPRKASRATAQGLYEWRVSGLQGQGGESRAYHFPLWSPHGCISGDVPEIGDAPHG